MENQRRLRLEILVPGLLLAAFLCDAAGRFVSLEPLTFRAGEGLSQFRSYWNPGPYEANRRYQNDRISGDLPNMANRMDYRFFREQTFTTDDLGFRNASEPGSAPPSVMMVGTSFTIGGGNSDRQTLPSQIETASGCRTYNAGGLSVRTDAILQVAKARGMLGGLIIVECLERYVGEPILPRKGRLNWLPYRDDLYAAYLTINDRLAISPLQIAMRRIYKFLQNDRILPNIAKEDVALRQLKDGQTSLFLLDLEKPRTYQGIPQNVEAYSRIRDELKAAGFDLALMIVPDKLTVYRSLLREPLPGKSESLTFLADLENSVRARDIPIVNLAPILIEGARLALEHGETVYWSDDTHWNPKGIEIAARAICDALNLRARCGARPN